MFGFINRFPYTNFHEINLDWLINSMKALENQFSGVKKEIDDAVIYMKDNIYATTTEIINAAIAAGDITVGITYDPVTEELDIIVS